MRVVIVDDHPVMRVGLRAVLGTSGDIEVVREFERPEDVIPWVQAHEVDLVLMDLRFGRATHESKVMDGTDGVRAIRQNDGPPVLIVTTYGSDPEVLGVLAAGAVGYVLKDSSTDELLTAIRAGVHGDRFLGTGVRGRMDSHDSAGSLALTSRELDVLRQVALGQTNAEIAEALFVSEATVKTHLNRTFDKLGVRSRTAAVARARAEGILEE